jgi:hypothetical protein
VWSADPPLAEPLIVLKVPRTLVPGGWTLVRQATGMTAWSTSVGSVVSAQQLTLVMNEVMHGTTSHSVNGTSEKVLTKRDFQNVLHSQT